jgi:hypothetical protein
VLDLSKKEKRKKEKKREFGLMVGVIYRLPASQEGA